MAEIPFINTGGEEVTFHKDRSLEDLLAAESLWVNDPTYPMHQKSPMANYSKVIQKVEPRDRKF